MGFCNGNSQVWLEKNKSVATMFPLDNSEANRSGKRAILSGVACEQNAGSPKSEKTLRLQAISPTMQHGRQGSWSKPCKKCLTLRRLAARRLVGPARGSNCDKTRY